LHNFSLKKKTYYFKSHCGEKRTVLKLLSFTLDCLFDKAYIAMKNVPYDIIYE